MKTQSRCANPALAFSMSAAFGNGDQGVVGIEVAAFEGGYGQGHAAHANIPFLVYGKRR
ncbi:MAG: hypothetical protein OXI90_08300 [Gammaproteobacteria bacterium]|nr:hypothetical protein [Gammaproteobacteria bacterium]